MLDQAKARADRAVAGVASARAGLLAAEANAKNAQVAVDYTLIRAPFDGIILSKSANVGDLVTPFPKLRMPTGYCYWIVESPSARDAPHVAAFRTWVQTEFDRGPHRQT